MTGLVRHASARLLFIAGAFAAVATGVRADGASDAVAMDINQASVSFDVATNVPALRVHGKSSAVTAHAHLKAEPEGFVIERIEARVPVSSLQTGLELRDQHMRKYIFTTAEGQVPDVEFSSDRAACPNDGRSQRATCVVSGVLTLRGTARPFAVTLVVSEERSVIRVSGHGIVKLSAYGIDQPSQLGVRTTDDVKLKVELTARRATAQAAVNSGSMR